MSKESARIRRSKKLRAKLQKVGLMRIAISRSLKRTEVEGIKLRGSLKTLNKANHIGI